MVHTKGHQWQNLPCQETAYLNQMDFNQRDLNHVDDGRRLYDSNPVQFTSSYDQGIP